MQALLKNKVFRIVMLTDLIQQTSIWVRNIALLFFIMESTNNDPVAVSILTVLEYLPIFIFSFIGGTLADRWNPKKTMITGDFLSAVSIAAIIYLVSIGYWQAAFVATFVSAIVSQFSLPSTQIMFKRHIPEEQVTTAIAISQSLSSLYIIVGPLLGTLIYSTFGIMSSLVVIMILFTCSAAVQFALPSSSKIIEAGKSTIVNEMKEGIKYVMSNKNLVVIAGIFVFLGLGQGLIQPLSVYVIVERLGLHKESLQWFYSLSGVGLLVGGALAASAAPKLKPKSVMFAGISVFAAAVVIEVLSVWVALTAGMQLLVGIMSAFMQIVLSTLIMKLVKEEYIGRTNGLISPIIMGGVLLGSSVSGILMKSISLMPTYFISAGIIFIGAVCSLGLKVENKESAGVELGESA